LPITSISRPFAEDVDRHTRTVRRWLNEPDGLPYTRMGNRILIHVPTAREWLMRRMIRPAPTRRHRRGRQPVQHAGDAVKRGRAVAKTRATTATASAGGDAA
jgi:hypothetical protein